LADSSVSEARAQRKEEDEGHCFAVRQEDGDLPKEGVTFSADGHLADEFLLWAGRGGLTPLDTVPYGVGLLLLGIPNYIMVLYMLFELLTHKIMNNPL